MGARRRGLCGGWRSRLLRQTSEKIDSRARGSRARFRRKPGSPRWTRASAGTSSVMVSFGGRGTGSLGTAPAESDDCRAATAKRWVAGREEVGPRRIGTRRRRRKSAAARSARTVGAGSPAGTAALDVATAPVKKLQASLRRDYNREHDGNPRRDVWDAWRDLGWPRKPSCGIFSRPRRSRTRGALWSARVRFVMPNPRR